MTHKGNLFLGAIVATLGICFGMIGVARAAINDEIHVTAVHKDDPNDTPVVHPTTFQGKFDKDPDADPDQIDVDNDGATSGPGGAGVCDILNDGALLAVIRNSGPVEVSVEGRKGWGAVYWVHVLPGDIPGGGVLIGGDQNLWADVQDEIISGTLVLTDQASAHAATDSTDTNADTPTLDCGVGAGGQIGVTLSYGVESGTYDWTITPSGGGAVVDSGTLTSEKGYSDNSTSPKLVAGNSYVLDLTITGNATFHRQIDFIIVQVVSLTVVSGATQTNVLQPPGPPNWATVQGPHAVIVQVTLNPNTDAAAANLDWSGGTQVAGNPRQQSFSAASAQEFPVQVGLGNSDEAQLNLWVIWVDVEIDADAGHSLNSKCITANANPTGPWKGQLGGGVMLGKADIHGVLNTYAYTIGKMQATGTIEPAGAVNVIRPSAWGWLRKVDCIGYDNGGNYNGGTWAAGPFINEANAGDGPSTGNSDLDPTATGGMIFNLDAPGCSEDLAGATIYHTSEIYDNFLQYATVTLNVQYVASEMRKWHYQAQVDVDAAQPVVLNDVGKDYKDPPPGPHFTKR